METTTPANDPGVTGSAPLYVKPEPLNFDQHKKLGLKQVELPFSFVAKQHFVPLLVGEFAAAALSYPIIFAGPESMPLAVMGINVGENLFFEPDGSVKPDAYLPAYVRRYPFTVASDEALGRMIVCIDVGSSLIGPNAEFPLFKDDGSPTDYTQRCIDFCQQFDVERKRTEEFVKLMRDHQLIESRVQTHTPTNPDGTPGQPVQIAEYGAVNEQKLIDLPDDKYLELKKTGAIGLIYAHLISLGGWERLVALQIARNNAKNGLTAMGQPAGSA
ncbi:MAG TPA: SapC family protein [Caulobacteraceae bacterium]|nr:SapC family protein [Caulobacteraceae bacterium]